MGATNFDGPLISYGNMGYLTQGPVPDPNQDSGPNVSFMGSAIPDVRFTFLKDQVEGFTGKVPAFWQTANIPVIDATPGATAADNIVAAANVTADTAMTLVNTATTAASWVPVVPMGASAAVNAIALDFGFTTGNCTAASTTIVVTDSSMFVPGMPLVIAGVGNSGGTAALLTNVRSITDSTHIVVVDAPLDTNSAAAIGTGNVWGPSELGFPKPAGALAYVARGPGLFLDPRQALTRVLSVAGSTSATGGDFVVAGYDIYGVAMTETITAAAGAGPTSGKKAFKYITSVTPGFTDAHNYSVGTTAVYGLHFRADDFAYVDAAKAGVHQTATTGFTAGTAAASGDVRGTYASAASTKLVVFQKVSLQQMLNADALSATSLYGPDQT